VIGLARRHLPPAQEFPTKPAECTGHEFRLPADLTEPGSANWVETQAVGFLANVQTTLDPTVLANDWAAHSARLTDAFLADVGNVLVWCSGKDLLAGLIPWLQMTHGLHPSQLRVRVRDWIVMNPDQTLMLLPEWEAFGNLLSAYP
jgi:hypothetical protein